MPILNDLGFYLQSQGFGTLGTDLFLGNRTVFRDPPGSTIPDEILGLFEIPGQPAMKTHDMPGPAVEQPHVQLRWRGVPYGYEAIRAQAQDAFLLLDSVVNQVINGVFYQQIVCLASPFGQPEDEWNRPYIIMEVWAKKAPS